MNPYPASYSTYELESETVTLPEAAPQIGRYEFKLRSRKGIFGDEKIVCYERDLYKDALGAMRVDYPMKLWMVTSHQVL